MARKGMRPPIHEYCADGNVRIVCGADIGQERDALHVVYPEGRSEALSSAQISRCSLLADISETSGLAELPFSAQEFRLWQRNTHESNVGLDEACTVLKVAEFLQDGHAPQLAKFAAHLFSGCCGDVPRGCRLEPQKVSTLHCDLPDCLINQVLKSVKLRLVLTKAPAVFHAVAVASRVHANQHVSFAKELLNRNLPQALSLIPCASLITSLDLSWNSMDYTGAAALALSLRSMPKLSHLDVSCNSMGNEAAYILAKEGLCWATGLTKLLMRQNSLWSSGVAWVAKTLSSLKALQVLDLSENELRVVVPEVANGSDNINNRSNVSDEGLNALQLALQRLPAIRELDLSGNMLSREGIHVLSQALPHLTNLERINLAHNNIGARGCESLMAYLPNVPALQEVNLSTNHFEAAGASLLWPAVTRMTALRCLKVLQNGLGSSTLPELRAHIGAGRLPRTLRELDMRLNGVPRSEAAQLRAASHQVVRCM